MKPLQINGAAQNFSPYEMGVKMGIVLEEADESAFWIELLIAANKAKPSPAAELLHEANELVAIAIASIKTARRNAEES